MLLLFNVTYFLTFFVDSLSNPLFIVTICVPKRRTEMICVDYQMIMLCTSKMEDVNIKDIDCDSLRRNTAIVLQDTVLFADSIENNLRYSNSSATDEQMYMAARMSNCDSMIRKMPQGYDTQLMSEGENISQGQRQLLSIARAFLAQPKILILDEATSSVDTRTEKHIQDAMVKLMKDRTSLIIAHRLSTIQDADLIVVMDEGRIAETGSHANLLAKKGKYYQLYMTQFAGCAT